MHKLNEAREYAVEVGSHRLEGMINIPEDAKGLVVFAHGSGSSCLSPRNTRVARDLNDRGLATLLFDLLTEDEAAYRANVFDIPLLGTRVAEAVRWARDNEDTPAVENGHFSTKGA